MADYRFKALSKWPLFYKKKVVKFLGEALDGDRFTLKSTRDEEGILVPSFFVAENLSGEVVAYAETLSFDREKGLLSLEAYLEGESEPLKYLLSRAAKVLIPVETEAILIADKNPENGLLVEAGFKVASAEYLFSHKSIKKMPYEAEWSFEDGKPTRGFELREEGESVIVYKEGSVFMQTNPQSKKEELMGVRVASLNVSVMENTICISDVFVDDYYRRQGIASALLSYCMHKYPDKETILHTEETNPGAVALYTRNGFEIKEVLYNYVR